MGERKVRVFFFFCTFAHCFFPLLSASPVPFAFCLLPFAFCLLPFAFCLSSLSPSVPGTPEDRSLPLVPSALYGFRNCDPPRAYRAPPPATVRRPSQAVFPLYMVRPRHPKSAMFLACTTAVVYSMWEMGFP